MKPENLSQRNRTRLLLPDGQVASYAGTPEVLGQLPAITQKRIEEGA